MSIVKWLDENLEKAILVTFLVIMSIVMGIQVIMRYVFNASLSWSEEISRYIFVWSAFISISYCIKNNISVVIDQFTEKLSANAKKNITIFANVVLLLFVSYMFIYSIEVVKNTYMSNQKSAALGIPIYLIHSSAILGFGLSIIRVIQRFFVVNNKQIN